MQNYYLEHPYLITDGSQEAKNDLLLKLTFVGTLSILFSNCMGPVAQLLLGTFGTRIVAVIAGTLTTLGMYLTSFSKEIYQLYLTHVCFGSGVSIMYMTIINCTLPYFEHQRGLAMGILASATGAGGLLISLLVTEINSSLGPTWTYRVLACIFLQCNVLLCVVIKDKETKPEAIAHRSFKWAHVSDLLRNSLFRTWTMAAVIQLLGYFVPLYYLPAYASYIGLSDVQGSSLIALSSAMNFLGRIACGFIADVLGSLTTNITFLLIAALSNLLIWMFASTYSALIVFSIVFGATGGSYFSLVPSITDELVNPEQFSTGLSIVTLSTCIAAFGTNIAGLLDYIGHTEPFLACKLFAGLAFIVAFFIMLALRLYMDRHFTARL